MATKIKDGMFIGDAEASQDPEFIELNKIIFVINCAGRQLPNLWEQYGLHYLTFPWTSDPDCVLFDDRNVVVVQISNFIDKALEKGDSVLVHSLDGTGRCIACVAAYLMYRHRWGFKKVLEFMCSKRPDAAPNTGFVQQLYHLDERLSAQRYGQNNETSEIKRFRHDQWVPIVPDTTSEGHQGRSRHISNRSIARGKNRGSIIGTGATIGRIGVVAAAFPSLGQMDEVQEEEIVLVHSFLNSQPQIDSLPPGQADYEDYVSKELHWIDRPRLDKLSAAGKLGRNDRRQYMIPVSPRTGRAVPERPGNSSYNGLSPNVISMPMAGPLAGILKTSKKERGAIKNEEKNKPRTPQLESDSAEPSGGLSNDGSTISGSARSGGVDHATPLSTSRSVGKLENEVVVEDLSDGVDTGKAEIGNADVGGLSANGYVQGSRLSPNRTKEFSTKEKAGAGSTDQRDSGHGKHGSVVSITSNETPVSGRVSRCKNGDDLFSLRSAEMYQGSSTAAARQAWAGDIQYEISLTNYKGKEEVQLANPTGGKENCTSPQSRAATGPSKSHRDYSEAAKKTSFQRAAKSWGGTGEIGEAAKEGRLREGTMGKMCFGKVSDTGGEPAQIKIVGDVNTTTIGRQRVLQRESDGNLDFSATEASMSTKRSYDKQCLPQAESGRTTIRDKVASSDPPRPYRDPAEKQSDQVAKDCRKEKTKITREAKVETFPNDNSEWGKKPSEKQHTFASGEGGGNLQQLAKTPNPQQRRLLSTRPRQDHDQNSNPPPQEGSRQQDVSASRHLFSQKHPTNSPSQRPNSRAGGSSECTGSNDDWSDNVVASKVASSGHSPPTPIGTVKERYPLHGVMPSGSILQLNGHEPNRSGGEAGRKISSGPRSSQDSEQRQNGVEVYRPERHKSSNEGPWPRELQIYQPPATPLKSSRYRGESTSPLPSDRLLDPSYTDYWLSPGGHRGSSNSSITVASNDKSCVGQHNAGCSLLQSRKTRNAGGSGKNDVKWSNPAPRERYVDAGGLSVKKPYPGSADNRDSVGIGGSGSTRTRKTSAEVNPSCPSHRLHTHQCPVSKSIRASGAPLYRSGSPAPTRGRRGHGDANRSTGVTSGCISNPERFIHWHKNAGRHPQQATRVPPGFRGYIASSIIGGGDSIDRGTTASRCSQVPPRTARDSRRRETSEGVSRQDAHHRDDAPRRVTTRTVLLPAATEKSGQRPSTSDGLLDGDTGGGVRGRRGVPSPAPRPSSASVRRRSSISSAANNFESAAFGRSTSRTSIPIESSLERPRWK